ncbi:MAG TPA: IscS subfamily cysteine desulfurase [Tepidisphaeraceae bacterium]|jgi:cysteine desulfurase
MNLPIYLDHNATTPLDRRVFAAMTPFFLDAFGNAASRGHAFGFRAMRAVDQARVQVAALLECEAREIIWTSGATESNNLAIKGVADMYAERGRHIITQTTEHKAVLDPCKKLSHQGYDVTFLDPDRTGRVEVEQLAKAIRPDTILVSIMAANNEIGTLAPIREIGRLCRERGAIFHCDATQAIGKVPIKVEEDCIDLLSMSGHKLYGPKGCGALYVRKRGPRVRLTPLLDGGGHEQGFRSGTLNVPGIVGVGAACELAMLEMPQESPRLAGLRDRLQAGILARLDGVTVNGNEDHRLPHVTNLSFAGVDGEQLLATLTRDLAVSSGSACTSASMEPSYVLRAIGVANDLAYASVRFSLGQSNDREQIDFAVETVVESVNRLRGVAIAV